MSPSAVLLAGGESRRMGTDKATVIFEGQPLWQHQLRLLRQLTPNEILVSARTEHSWKAADAKLVLDQPPSRGPISGIAAALKAARASHLVVLAVDMPFMTTSHLRQLADEATRGAGVVPMIRGRAEPLAAIYPKEADVDVAAALAGEDWSLQPLIRRMAAAGKLKMMRVSDSDAHLYRSINEPKDLSG